MNMELTDRQQGNQPTSQIQQPIENLKQHISRRAYELYLERGEQSDPSQNWLDAEKEILGALIQPMSEQSQATSGEWENQLHQHRARSTPAKSKKRVR
jgi:Protein of unknown function (DUF2934)